MMRARSGVTLIEIVVVLAILGVLAAVSVPAFRDLASPDPLREGTAAVVRVLERARITARTAGHRVTVTIDPAGRRYWIDAPALTGAFELPRGVTLWSDRARPRISFDAAGVTSADALALQWSGRAAPVVVDRFTGQVATRAH